MMLVVPIFYTELMCLRRPCPFCGVALAESMYGSWSLIDCWLGFMVCKLLLMYCWLFICSIDCK
jgi:hypothetical protein